MLGMTSKDVKSRSNWMERDGYPHDGQEVQSDSLKSPYAVEWERRGAWGVRSNPLAQSGLRGRLDVGPAQQDQSILRDTEPG